MELSAPLTIRLVQSMHCYGLKLHPQHGSHTLQFRPASLSVSRAHRNSVTAVSVFPSSPSCGRGFTLPTSFVCRATSGNFPEAHAGDVKQSERHEDVFPGNANDHSSDDEDTDEEEEEEEAGSGNSQPIHNLGGSSVVSSDDEQSPIPDGVTAAGPLSSVVSAIRGVQQSKLVRMVTYWPAWLQKRKLQQLAAQANEQPSDPEKEAAYLAELIHSSPQAVVDRFESRQFASNEQSVVTYLRALVATNRIASLASSLPTTTASSSDASMTAVSLPQFLMDLRQRLVGEDERYSPGCSEITPMHVVMMDSKSRPVGQPSAGVRVLQEVALAVLSVVVGVLVWVGVMAAVRRYANGVAGMAGGGSATSNGLAGMGGVGGGGGAAGGSSVAGAYAPKEFNKETMPEKSLRTFNDVKGCDEAKEELEEVVEYLRDPARFTRLGGKLPKGVLLVGPPGTGKTLLAKAVAGEAGVPFFYRAGSEFEEMFVGVGARRVRTLFQAAKKKAPCIVFIDEIDAIGGSRKQWEGHTKKTLNQLLVEMDGFDANEGIIVIAATNLPEMLDPALTRPGRFDRHITVSLPDIKGRKEILSLYLADKPLADDVDTQVLARGTPGFSGADLANLVNIGAVKAALDSSPVVALHHLEFAKDRILMGAERKSMAVSEECRKNTAYHESGHAIVALHTPGALPIHKATIMPRGAALGMVTQLPTDDFETSRSKQQMLARLDVCMGGRVAEEMVFGAEHVTSGARDDLRQATRLARHMVMECGMSDAIGPVFLDPEADRLGTELVRTADGEVSRMLKEAYDRVRQLLKRHEADLHKFSKALLERETLTASDIAELMKS